MPVKARFRCNQVSDHRFGSGPENVTREVQMSAVYSSDPTHPNHAFWASTPTGTFTISMTPKAGAFDAFKAGQLYEFTIEPVDPSTQG